MLLHLGDRHPRLHGPLVVCHHGHPADPLLAREEFTPLGQDERTKLVAVSAWGDFVIDWRAEFDAWVPPA